MKKEEHSCHALLFAAHCDDAELWAGGTIARWSNRGLKTCVAIFAHDAARQSETLEAASILGFEPMFKDNKWDSSEWALGLIAQRSPEVLMTHPENDPHPVHQAVCRAVLSALAKHCNRKFSPRRWYFFDTYYLSRSPATLPLLVDISETWEKKKEALSRHRSQDPSSLIRMAQHSSALQGMRARFAYAEGFYPFDLLGRWPILRELP